MNIVHQHELLEEYYNHFPLSEYFGFDICPYTSIVKFNGAENILCEGEKPDSLYYLINGRAKLFLSHENGRTSLINFLNAPCFVGEMELLGAQETANGVTAITPCTCYEIHINECRDKILNDTKFLRYLCLFLSQKAIGNTYNYSKNQKIYGVGILRLPAVQTHRIRHKFFGIFHTLKDYARLYSAKNHLHTKFPVASISA